MLEAEDQQDSQSRDWRKADARILGQIMAAQNVIFALPDAVRVAEFYAQALISIPGIVACRVCLERTTIQKGELGVAFCEKCPAWQKISEQSQDTFPIPGIKCRLAAHADIHTVEVHSLYHHFGFFALKISAPDTFEIYQSFISNLANYVALSLENRLQQRLLQKAHKELEHKVAERTKDLAATNAHLQAEIEQKRRAEEALRESEARFRAVFENSVDAIGVSKRGSHVFVNPAYLALYGYSDNAELAGKPILDLIAPSHREQVLENVRRRASGQPAPIVYETRGLRKDGSEFDMDIHVSTYDLNGETYTLPIIHDITERKQAEMALQRLNRELRAISNCNQTLLRAEDEQTLLNDICRIVCEEAGYRMAWVGFAEQDEARTMHPASWAGVEDGYLAAVKITWAETERGRGPTGVAIRSGVSVCIQDFTADLQTLLWHEKALQRGYRSCIALPLKDESAHTFGALTMYSTEPNAFTPDEVRLLEELAGDLAFGITTLRARVERKLMAEALAAREREFRTLAENSPDNIARYDVNCRTIYVNPTLERSLGSLASEMLGTTPMEAALIAENEIYQEKIAQVFKTGINDEMDIVMPDKGEGVNYHNIRFVAERSADGAITGVQTIGRDITERKRHELEHQAHLHFFESMDQINRAIQGTNDLTHVMSSVLDLVLSIFDCDRAFLMYPCDPDAATWYSPMERNKPEYPGIRTLGLETPMDSDVAETLRILLASDGPVQFGLGTPHPLPMNVSERFSIKSFMSMALFPKVGRPWQFGIHQCSYPRTWSSEEERLFQEIGRRLGDALTSLLTFRNLQESEQRYRMVFENSPVSIWDEDFSGIKTLFDALRREGVVDIEAHFARHPESVQKCAALMKIVDVNKAALTLHAAADKNELLAELVKTFTPESFDTFRQELVCLWNGEMEITRDAVVKTLAGEPRNVTVYVSVCPGYEQSLSKVLVSLTDMTERKRMEEALANERAMLRAVIDLSPDAIFVKDMEGRKTLTNPADMERIGVHLETEALGKTDFEVYSQDVAARFYVNDQAVLQAGQSVLNREEMIVTHDGQLRCLLTSKVPLRNSAGQVIGLVGVGRDITERKQAEQEIQKLNQDLEQRVADRTAQLEAANKELEAFAYSVSHDLRTPLRHINGFLEMLQEQIGATLDEQSRHYMTNISEAAKRMNMLINDLLSFSRMSRQEMSTAQVNLNQLIQEIIQEFEPEAEGRNIAWQIGVLPVVTGDRAMLHAVLVNLISNALKYTRPRLQAEIEMGCLTDQEQGNIIFVRDNGVGFDMKYADKLFGVFQRLHRADEFEGTGIGLANVQRIIHRHGGKTWAEAQVDHGATFYFSLPLN